MAVLCRKLTLAVFSRGPAMVSSSARGNIRRAHADFFGAPVTRGSYRTEFKSKACNAARVRARRDAAAFSAEDFVEELVNRGGRPPATVPGRTGDGPRARAPAEGPAPTGGGKEEGGCGAGHEP